MLGLTLGATFASPSTPLVIGVNEDHPKFQQDAGAAMFGELSTIGLTESVISVRWDPAQPETIPDEEHLVAVIAAAKEKGVKVVLAVYPAKARAVADNGPAGFVEFCGRVATAFPDAAAFIVGNEPNQPRFWQPQFKADGSQASAAAFLTVLAGCYDAIHPTGKQVIGVGLSPRGNDNPRAPSNVSTSPVRFIRALGAAYRASGRRAADHGRVQLPPVPQREHRHAVRRLPVAERRHAELRPDQAGALGRLQRHEAAAHRDRPAALAGRDRLAGPDRGE